MNAASKIILCLSLTVSTAGLAAADVLTGKDGMTLYTFDKDSENTSACNGQCAALWPPARPGDASGKGFGEIVRDDGSRQLSYQGKPLYYYINDRKPGDITGDKVKNVWHIVSVGGGKKRTSAYSGGNFNEYSY